MVPFLAPMERTAEFSAVVKQFKLTDSGNAASKLDIFCLIWRSGEFLKVECNVMRDRSTSYVYC